MDEELKSAAQAGDEDRCRALLLTQAARTRAAVGLGERSDLSALQLASLYEPMVAGALLASGVECDLHSACALGRTDDIARLAAPDPGQRAHEGNFATLAEDLTPMGFALLRGQLEAVWTLLRAGDDANRPLRRIGFYVWEMDALAEELGDWRPLHAVCAHGYHEDATAILGALIAEGADVNALCVLGEAPLHIAATYGWMCVMERLFAAGAAVDQPSAPVAQTLWRISAPAQAPRGFGYTPLMIATREGKGEAVRLLLSAGAYVNERDSNGATPLHHAARPWWREDAAVAAMLLDAGGDATLRDRQGRTPGDLAQAAGHAETAEALRKACAASG